MKNLGIIVFTILLAACSGSPDKNMQTPSMQLQGGVDVGNMESAIVPTTSASLSYPKNWVSSATVSGILEIKNKSGSVIEARRAEIKELVSPNAFSLQKYLNEKYPERKYEIVKFNGLEGVRAELAKVAGTKKSDLYLVSEVKDFIHIQSDLKKSDDGISEGDQIILTVRMKYQGVAYQNSSPKTVTLKTVDNLNTYSFSDDCYTYTSPCNSRGVRLRYLNSFSVDDGRIVDLGPESQISFESIKIEGDYLIAPWSNIPITDIYTAFTPQDPQAEQSKIKPKEGHVYLVRTIRWPDEDIITKLKVEKLSADSATITYQKLVYVNKKELQKQVDLINKYTLENEAPQSSGEVVLYNRSVWDNYYYASFNFQYSTSGNVFITRNSWDLLFSHCGDKVTFSVPHSSMGIGATTDLGVKDLDAITSADFPDPNTYKNNCGAEVIKGHTYSVYHYGFSDASLVRGAVQVLDMDSNKKWVRLKFKRISVGAADDFQNWIPLAIPQETQSVTLEILENQHTASFYPFNNRKPDVGFHHHEKVLFYSNVLDATYGNKRGVFKLPAGTAINALTAVEIESLKGKFSSKVELATGDVIAMLIENYFNKTIMVMKVESLEANKKIQLSIKYLQRAKTPYSDDKE